MRVFAERPELWIPLVPFTIALISTITIAVIILTVRSQRRRRPVATGTVMSHDEFTDNDGTSYTPVVRFTAANGRSVEFRNNMGTMTRSPAVGAKVQVRYDAARPEQAHIVGRSALMLVLWIFLAASVLTLIAASAFFALFYFLPDIERATDRRAPPPSQRQMASRAAGPAAPDSTG